MTLQCIILCLGKCLLSYLSPPQSRHLTVPSLSFHPEILLYFCSDPFPHHIPYILSNHQSVFCLYCLPFPQCHINGIITVCNLWSLGFFHLCSWNSSALMYVSVIISFIAEWHSVVWCTILFIYLWFEGFPVFSCYEESNYKHSHTALCVNMFSLS